MIGCNGCQFPMGNWSADWHRRHEAHHLAMMGATADDITRANLRWFVELAEQREAA